MRKFVPSLLLLMLCISFFFPPSMAQDRKLVTGRIINKTTGKPFGKNDVVIEIFGFDTEALAEDALQVMKSGQGTITSYYEILPPDEGGYYQATLPETGAIIFRPGISDPILEKIKYRTEINVAIEGGEIITASTKTVETGSITGLDPEVEIQGNYLYASNPLRVPKNIGRSNARLILQPFFIGATLNDTLACLKPWVYDGSEYALTQERRMAYEKSNDPLMQFVADDTLSTAELLVPWCDTIYLDNPRGRYYVKGKVIVEDYNTVIYVKDSLPLASSRARRPMQFLDYQLDFRHLNHDEYRERARPEKMDTKGEMSLTFLVNRAELDDSDPNNAISLNSLKNTLYRIATGTNSKLKEFHVIGIASPDGKYDKNFALANKRTQYAYKEVMSALPASVERRVYSTNKSIVAPWTDVADLLEKDGHTAEAEEIRSIVKKYSRQRDEQFSQIRRLKYYRSLVTPVLPKLRTVKYTFKHEELRELTPEEILERYRTDESYKSGGKHFAKYEYWNLFGIVKEKDELVKLYRRAYEETKADSDDGKPWILAANNLAVTCLEKGQPDTTILAGHIDERWKCNRRFTNLNGSVELVNPEAVVANQLCMFLMSNKFRRASVMAQMLPDTEKNRVLKAVTMCLGGYFRGGKTEEEKRQRMEWFEIVKESTPRNKVVMLLAPNTRAHTLLAEKAVAELPKDDPLTWYFMAIISGRKCKYPDADFMEQTNFETYLMQCFDMDPQYVGIARADGDIDEDLLKEFFKYNEQYDKL